MEHCITLPYYEVKPNYPGLNDLESIRREMCFINSVTPIRNKIYNLYLVRDFIISNKIGIACVCTPNIPLERRHLIWYVMLECTFKDYDWIVGRIST